MNTKIANRVSTITIIVNLLLSLLKFVIGVISHSGALISDGVHSASDVISTLAVIFGVNIAAKKSDAQHQYGHERIESVFSIILAMLLFATGIGIGLSAIKIIMHGEEITIPGKLALIAAVVSIAIKEWMYHFTKNAADKIDSTALMADAWHHRSDALSSIGSLIGIGGAIIGFPICEPIASIVICIFIMKAAYDIFMDAVNSLIDTACSEDEVSQLKQVITKVDGVESLDLLQTRKFASKIYVDVEISVNGNLSLYQAHDISEKVHDNVEDLFPNVKHCMVHVNPSKPTK